LTQTSPLGPRLWLISRGPFLLSVFTWACILSLMGLCILIGGPAQDLLPFQAAAELAKRGSFEGVYPPQELGNLFDVNDRFREVSLVIAGEEYPAESVTAFVAPPPAIILGQLLPSFSTLATCIWRVIIAATLLLSLVLLECDLRRTTQKISLSWNLVVLGMLPLMLYVVFLGQTSAVLMAAATVTALAASTTRSLAGGFLLGVVTGTKAFPGAIILAAAFMRRRLFAAIALMTLAVMSLIVLIVAPLTLWSDFFAVFGKLGTHVVADWNNASLDAGLTALALGRVNPMLVQPPLWARMLALVARASLVGLALWIATRRGSINPRRRWSAIWVALLASTPLLWLHYLVSLLPALQVELREGNRVAPVLMAFGLSAGLLTFRLLPSGLVSTFNVVGWLAAGSMVLSFALREHRRRM
jgi:hypothetical protein